MAAAALVAGCATTPPAPQHPVIADLLYGALCDHGRQDAVCASPASGQPAVIEATGDSSCTYAKKLVACTWYGYSFDYVLGEDGANLDCEQVSDVKSNHGNIDTVLDTNTAVSGYTVHLNGRKGHHVQRQYLGRSPVDRTEHMKQSCSYRGEKLFEVEFLIHHHAAKPDKPSQGVSSKPTP
ncbi:MAG TPA: hypothetical protein VG889_19435 [Rhizomicrobium sp.]|nr:hypothetical protein [Rhizomicrobium sp.]